MNWVNENDIPLDTEIDALVGNFPCTLKRIVYCKELKSVTVNPMGTHLSDNFFKGKITSVID